MFRSCRRRIWHAADHSETLTTRVSDLTEYKDLEHLEYTGDDDLSLLKVGGQKIKHLTICSSVLPIIDN
jgi:hypothetical protein